MCFLIILRVSIRLQNIHCEYTVLSLPAGSTCCISSFVSWSVMFIVISGVCSLGHMRCICSVQ